MKTKVYNLAGKEVSELELNDAIFAVKVKPTVVHEVFVAQMGNARQPWADTKTRGEVRGGGKKPWPQKGTGRARHGSIRSPIWKGGGVAFGPKSNRSFATKINKQTKLLATKMCLADRLQHEAFLVVDNFDFSDAKTKLFAGLLKNLPTKNFHSFLVVTDGKDGKVVKMTNNLPKVETMRAEDISVVDLVNKQAVIASVGAVKKLEMRLNK